MANVILKRSNGTTFETTKEWYDANKKHCDFVGTTYLQDSAEPPSQEVKAEKAGKEKI